MVHFVVRVALDRVRRLAQERGLTLTEALQRAGVSRNAFYHLSRRPTVIPRSVSAMATVLGVPVAALLDERPPSTAERAHALLSEARAIHARSRGASFDNIWHTLWLLEVPPVERLRRSLTRGRPSALYR